MTGKGRAVKNFWYFFVAYATVWTGLWIYLMRLSQKNHELRADVQALQAQVSRVVQQ